MVDYEDFFSAAKPVFGYNIEGDAIVTFTRAGSGKPIVFTAVGLGAVLTDAETSSNPEFKLSKRDQERAHTAHAGLFYPPVDSNVTIELG